MSKETLTAEEENRAMEKLMEVEDLAEKKVKIYSRLLTDAALAEDMKSLAQRHEKRKEELFKLAFGKKVKKEKKGGMSEMNEGEERE